MSGGHFNYAGFRIQQGLQTIANDDDVKDRWQRISAILFRLGDILYDLEHDLDWDLSGDHLITDVDFENRKLGLILTEVMKQCPDDWFPRGKWATIQAFQAHSKCEK